jgi:hypothetical protein
MRTREPPAQCLLESGTLQDAVGAGFESANGCAESNDSPTEDDKSGTVDSAVAKISVATTLVVGVVAALC